MSRSLSKIRKCVNLGSRIWFRSYDLDPTNMIDPLKSTNFINVG